MTDKFMDIVSHWSTLCYLDDNSDYLVDTLFKYQMFPVPNILTWHHGSINSFTQYSLCTYCRPGTPPDVEDTALKEVVCPACLPTWNWSNPVNIFLVILMHFDNYKYSIHDIIVHG